jgi:hypothetical protein
LDLDCPASSLQPPAPSLQPQNLRRVCSNQSKLISRKAPGIRSPMCE